MVFKGFTQKTINDGTAKFYGTLPEIDLTRLTIVYVRQSDEDADSDHGESRQTQLDLIEFARQLRRQVAGDYRGILLYDEGAGVSGQKEIEERPKLNELWRDMEKGRTLVKGEKIDLWNGLYSTGDGKTYQVGQIIVAREDRLFRDRHGGRVGTFTDKAEKKQVCVIVPPVNNKSSIRFYDFSNLTHLRAFQEKMKDAYDYIAYHIGYMHLNQKNKSGRGCYDGRSLPPGLVISKLVEKEDQKPIIYQPWADKMKWVFERFVALNYRLPLLVREIEKLPYLFPAPTEDDYAKYMLKTRLERVAGGFKPSSKNTIKDWLLNVAFIGWWTIDQKTREVIPDNHEAIIDKALFYDVHSHITGYTPDGVKVYDLPSRQTTKAGGGRETPIEALMHGLITAPNGRIVLSNRDGWNGYYCVYTKDQESKFYPKPSLALPYSQLDAIVVERLRTLANTDKYLADKIQESLDAIHQAQQEEVISIHDQIASYTEQIKRVKANLIRLAPILDPDNNKDDKETIDTIGANLRGLTEEKAALEAKETKLSRIKGEEHIQRFYSLLGNFDAKWKDFGPQDKQLLISLLTKKIELQPLSPHWALLKIHWIAPVNASIEALTGKGAFHPDVCAVWRLNGARPDNFEQWELDLIREHYPTCPNYTTLLKLLPTRTWNGISKAANVQGVKTERGIKREVDMPLNACWQDIEVLPDYERGLAMIEEANKHCRKGGDRTLYGFWLLPTDTPKASPGTISEGETVTLTMGSLGQPDRTPYHR